MIPAGKLPVGMNYTTQRNNGTEIFTWTTKRPARLVSPKTSLGTATGSQILIFSTEMGKVKVRTHEEAIETAVP
jgi:hypothetical protein